MRKILPLLALFLASCSALPTIADGTPLPTQPAQTATVTAIPEPTIDFSAGTQIANDLSVANQSIANQQEQARQMQLEIDALRRPETDLKIIEQQNAIELARLDAENKKIDAENKVKDAEAAKINKEIMEIKAKADAEFYEFQKWGPTGTAAAEYIEALPGIRTAEYSLTFVVCLFVLAGTFWLLVSSSNQWHSIELKAAQIAKAKQLQNLAELERVQPEPAEEPQEQEQTTQGYKPSTFERFTIPCSEETFDKFAEYAIKENAALGQKILEAGLDWLDANEYKSMREVFQANGWTVNAYSNNTLKLSDAGRKVCIDWQNGDGLPDGYKFK